MEPFFHNHNIAISMSCSDLYVPYLSVCLDSLISHSSIKYNYDIIIFERSITENNKNILRKQINKSNISLRFVNPSSIINNYNFVYPSFYALECFFRLASPLILNSYHRVIFTDVDLIFNKDIAELYNFDLNGKPLAACHDLIMNCFLNSKELDWFDYYKNDLKLENPFKYFNTGVLILDIDIFNGNAYSKKLLDLASKREYRILEQDVLNIFFKDNIEYLDTRWNFAVANDVYLNLLQHMNPIYRKKYHLDEDNPSIIHWAGASKPWNKPLEKYANLWWNLAAQNSFYGLIIDRYIENKYLINRIDFFKKLKRLKRKKIIYKIFCKITFGKIKKRYTSKRVKASNKIKEMEDYIKLLNNDVV